MNGILSCLLSLPPRGAWIEISFGFAIARVTQSLPPRGAWIEILIFPSFRLLPYVAPPTGSVDRNLLHSVEINTLKAVAPPTGSVDRNCPMIKCIVVIAWSLPPRGAWIEIINQNTFSFPSLSLPPRGAWIEIPAPNPLSERASVAPPTGSVDRNMMIDCL